MSSVLQLAGVTNGKPLKISAKKQKVCFIDQTICFPHNCQSQFSLLSFHFFFNFLIELKFIGSLKNSCDLCLLILQFVTASCDYLVLYPFFKGTSAPYTGLFSNLAVCLLCEFQCYRKTAILRKNSAQHVLTFPVSSIRCLSPLCYFFFGEEWTYT